ncbi:MAG: hypothetical protein GC137_01875 [Alphaproteobacteria bacterium]|nr:hypothetical protein [Alphaproteobacteria bacterium]
MRFSYFLATIILFLCIALPSYAIEVLSFDHALRPATKFRLQDFLKDSFNTELENYDVAEADLNDDGLSEYILKKRKCGVTNNFCTHLIIGEAKSDMILLSNIRARHIAIADTKTGHVRDILVFKNQINDYEFDIYMWSQNEKMYILNESK